MQSRALWALMIIISIYALYDFLSTKKFEWITVESKLGIAFLVNILTLSSFVNIFEIYDVELHFTVYIAVLLTFGILIQYLTTHFGGFRYKVPYSDTDELSVMLKNVLWYQGYKDVEQIVEYRENKFLFPGEKKTIELEFREGFFSKTNYHYLKFKKWTHRESREAITESLDTKLARYEPKANSTLSKTIELILILVVMVGFFGYYNFLALRPNEMPIYDGSSPPETLLLEDYDILISDPSMILSFEDQFEDSYAIYVKRFTPKNVDDTVIKVTYGDPYRTLFIGPNFSYLYVDFEKLKNKSTWDNIIVSVYNLYGDEKGVYYSLFATESFYDELTRLIQNN